MFHNITAALIKPCWQYGKRIVDPETRKVIAICLKCDKRIICSARSPQNFQNHLRVVHQIEFSANDRLDPQELPSMSGDEAEAYIKLEKSKYIFSKIELCSLIISSRAAISTKSVSTLHFKGK